MIFYFTATGNSLHVAKQLDEEIVSIPQIIAQDELKFKAEKIGIVTPVYSGKLPDIVQRFLEKADFETEYFYFILTYGAHDTVGPEWAMIFAENIGIMVNYADSVHMVDNWLPSFDMQAEMAMDKKIPEQIARIKENIAQRKDYIKKSNHDDRAFFAVVRKRMRGMGRIGGIVKIQDNCTGCGICAKVCPVGNVKLENGKATYAEPAKCEACLACAHACPAKNITITWGEKNPDARYRNPNVTLAEIIQANQQNG